jgi:undecaprenyl-diphosphatase
MKTHLSKARVATGAALMLAALIAAVPALALAPDEARYAPAVRDSTSLDVRAFRLLNGSAANPLFDAIMPFATDFDKWRIVVILVWAALVIRGKAKGRWAALALIPVIAVSDQISSGLMKPLIERLRPCDVIGNVHLWHGAEGWITTPAEIGRSYKPSFSFPSGHAANITASMLFLGLVYRRALAPLLAVAVIVSFSRIYIGVHWPSDVLAGMALGAAIGALAYALFRRLYRESAKETNTTRSEQGTPPSG